MNSRTVTECAFGSFATSFGPNQAGNAGLNYIFLQCFQLLLGKRRREENNAGYRNAYGVNEVSVTVL